MYLELIIYFPNMCQTPEIRPENVWISFPLFQRLFQPFFLEKKPKYLQNKRLSVSTWDLTVCSTLFVYKSSASFKMLRSGLYIKIYILGGPKFKKNIRTINSANNIRGSPNVQDVPSVDHTNRCPLYNYYWLYNSPYIFFAI